MPSAPELRNAARNIRIIEVFKEVKAEYFSESDCHIAVTGEVEIDMKRICYGIKPEEKNGFIAGRLESIAKLAEEICNENFL